jgi:hypothetical protein
VLTGPLGVRLLLLMGDPMPLPAPAALVTGLSNVEVTTDDRAGDGFQLTFRVAKDTPIDYSPLLSGVLDPFQRVIVAVLFGAVPEVLIDGVITHQSFAPSEDPAGSTVTVTGSDLSQVLDLEERNEEFPNQPDFVIAARVLAGYATYGLIPATTPTTDYPIFLQRIPRQQETDLRFLRRLAERNGYVFYIEPLAPGASTAYFGPENRLSLPQPALTMGMGAATNLRSMRFSQDGLAPVAPSGTFVEPITKTALPIPPLPSLKVPPLALSPSPARRTVLERDTAQEGPARAALSVLSSAMSAPDSVTAQGEVDSVRYGHALRARRLVGVRGAGFTYDGLYYVQRVTHTIGDGSYAQRFSLSREGTGSLVPAVIP